MNTTPLNPVQHCNSTRIGSPTVTLPKRLNDPFSNVIRIEHLFISPGHNFFGHHGQPAGQSPIVDVKQIECVAGRGIKGDRFFDYRENYRGQITFFAMEVFDALRLQLNLPAAQPQATRRNVFTRGVDLSALIGRQFEVHGVRFAGVEESKPCYWMNEALGAGAENWLQGRAGLRARILTDGVLRRESCAFGVGPEQVIGIQQERDCVIDNIASCMLFSSPKTSCIGLL